MGVLLLFVAVRVVSQIKELLQVDEGLVQGVELLQNLVDHTTVEVFEDARKEIFLFLKVTVLFFASRCGTAWRNRRNLGFWWLNL